MKTFQSIDEILNFAIAAEQEAADFYTGLANQAELPDMQKAFKQFAREEMGHKARLEHIKVKGVSDLPKEKVQDLKISDYMADVKPRTDMDYREALMVAMNNEKAAFKLYTRLAGMTENPEYQQLFQGLAQEEAKHKLRFELEYDEIVLREN